VLCMCLHACVFVYVCVVCVYVCVGGCMYRGVEGVCVCGV
jgi:hypothetical protein